jgi:peptidoglycan/xylan/chitin deacetylase (PgdA/CDA1 family)
MSTRVAITFDIEFDINGAFTAPDVRMPRGRAALIGESERGSGLPVILDILARHSVKATFFVEALQVGWFGPNEMGEIVDMLRSHGHEIQLHLHPVWLLFDNPDWQELVEREPPQAQIHDTLLTMPRRKVIEIIERGKDIFRAWGLPQPTAIRTGSLFVDRHLYPIFRECGFTVSSSVGLGLYKPGDPGLRLYQSAKLVDGVLEAPVSSYIGADRTLRMRTRLATLIGTGTKEQDTWIELATKRDMPLLVILSHVSEFHSDVGGKHRRNKLTERKLERLCGRLNRSDALQAVTIGDLPQLVDIITSCDDLPLTLPRWVSGLRLLESGLQKAPNL